LGFNFNKIKGLGGLYATLPPVLSGEPTGNEAVAAKKRSSKTKYTCPACGLNAWAKPEAKLICGECVVPLLADVQMP